ncbi:hypothetical protein [Streptomyces lydicus]|uniref:hypothetical protein n=1 Tax=Streptomyces lydicus TaxID=47763 RepID=UPI00379F57AB
MTEPVLSKLSPDLLEHLASAAVDNPVEVILELQPLTMPNGTRQERVAALREAFDREVRPIVQLVEEAHGRIVERAWINQTARAVIPAGAIPAVASEASVARIDLPDFVHPDVKRTA